MAKYYDAEVGDYDAHWSYVIYGIRLPDGSRSFSVRVYPRGQNLENDGPVDPLYPTLAAAKSALPSFIEKAKQRPQ